MEMSLPNDKYELLISLYYTIYSRARTDDAFDK